MTYLSLYDLTSKGKARLRRAGETRGIHQLVWTLFSDGPDRKRDWLYSYDTATKQITVRSQRKPVESPYLKQKELRKEYFSPEEGDVYFIRCDFNPTSVRNGKQIDRVIDARKQGYTGEDVWYSEYMGWWQHPARRERFGYEVVDLLPVHHEQREDPHKRRKISVATVVGQLRVTDPEKFQNMLRHGIGKEKGYGCGLVLAKRVSA